MYFSFPQWKCRQPRDNKAASPHWKPRFLYNSADSHGLRWLLEFQPSLPYSNQRRKEKGLSIFQYQVELTYGVTISYTRGWNIVFTLCGHICCSHQGCFSGGETVDVRESWLSMPVMKILPLKPQQFFFSIYLFLLCPPHVTPIKTEVPLHISLSAYEFAWMWACLHDSLEQI